MFTSTCVVLFHSFFSLSLSLSLSLMEECLAQHGNNVLHSMATLPLSHTHPQTTIPYTALRRTSSATFAASGCTSSSAATTSSPAPFLAAKCRGSLPSCARADSRQSQHTTHAASQQGGQKALCSCLLPLCESVMRPSCSLRVQYVFVCVCLGRERGCVCESER